MTAPSPIAAEIETAARAVAAARAALETVEGTLRRLRLAAGLSEPLTAGEAATSSWPPDPSTIDLNERDEHGRPVWCSPSEIAFEFHVDERTARRWAAKYPDAACRVGGRVRLNRDRLQQMFGTGG